VLWYYEFVFPDRIEKMRLQKLATSTKQEDRFELHHTETQRKFAFSEFRTEILKLIQWRAHVTDYQYAEHVNKLAADAPGLKKMLTDRNLSQEEQNEREATGIAQFEESFIRKFDYDPTTLTTLVRSAKSDKRSKAPKRQKT